MKETPTRTALSWVIFTAAAVFIHEHIVVVVAAAVVVGAALLALLAVATTWRHGAERDTRTAYARFEPQRPRVIRRAQVPRHARIVRQARLDEAAQHRPWFVGPDGRIVDKNGERV